jgi:hypothetical protein
VVGAVGGTGTEVRSVRSGDAARGGTDARMVMS